MPFSEACFRIRVRSRVSIAERLRRGNTTIIVDMLALLIWMSRRSARAVTVVGPERVVSS